MRGHKLTAIMSAPMITPAMIRIAGVIQLLSNAYLTKKTTPRKNANPPIHAKSFTPRIDSQLNGCCGFAGAGADAASFDAVGCGRVTEAGSGGGTAGGFADAGAGVEVSPRRSRSEIRFFSS